MTTMITTTKSFSAAAAARWRGGDDRDEVEEGGRDGNATEDRVRSLRSAVVPHLHTPPRPRNDRVHRVDVNVDVIGGGGIDSSGRSTTLLPLVLYSYEGNQFCRLVREGIKGKFLP